MTTSRVGVVLAWIAAASAASAQGSGARLAFEKELRGNTDIYVVPAAGGVERRLTDHPATDILPRWSPDGGTIYFSSDRSGRWQVFAVPAAGGEARPLRDVPQPEWQADPRPDGIALAFVSERGDHDALVAGAPGGTVATLVVHGGRARLGNPHWSRDASRIVFSSNKGLGGHRIYVLDLATGEDRLLSPLMSGGCEPRFHPGGQRVAYVRRRRATRERSWIVEHDLSGDTERVLVDWPVLNYDPVYSPDGAELAFASEIDGRFAVFRMRLSDGRTWRVTFGEGASRHPDYEPR